ncbi:glycine--tRNA ligase subunit beta [Granulicella cerasi]|uniref:Glycine--tRNA ligase beta subunit n=1 Tax=Granulicella cerasi TaxID=741063 RepID=A0ABW1ZDU5_9BACT|nr:glycine--tRNA ligase subunit beta [Granulicella cerasi]
MAEFLFEIGLEEVPARMIPGAEAELLRRVVALLGKEHLLPEGFEALSDAKSYSSPRRLAVYISDVLAVQPDITEEATGPAVKIAFKDGVPTPAAEAFAKKNGIAVSELKTITTPKGEYIAASTVKKGRSAAEVIASELPKELAAIYWAKNMRWIPGSTQTFVRPVQWMVCLLGDAVVPVEFAGKTAERVSFGHRVLSSGEAFEVQTPASYLAQLEGEYVLADVEARRHKIRKTLDHVCRTVPGARWREDEALVEKMTHLVEWPDVLLGSFEPEYLALPEEVLVTVMRDHQNYFALEGADGKLLPYFLAVTNISLTEANAPIIKGNNERVLRARFNDARFFWEFDQRTPLEERVKLLENVTFQKDLGTYALKSERIGALAAKLAQGIDGVDTAALAEAARLAKADLTTELVKEFTELQGVIGGLYAKSQGVSAVAADAIYDQYTPASMEDGVPRSLEGALLGVADRADTIAGMFGLGLEPTGSKDPFALRRAANSIVKILVEGELALTLQQIVEHAAKDEATATKMLNFFRDRVEFYMREVNGTSYDVVAAVLAAGFYDVRDAVARAAAVSAARGGDDFIAVSAAFKRMKNILTQANFALAADAKLAPAGVAVEDALIAKFNEVEAVVTKAAASQDYAAALASIATLRKEVDAFFEGVMVNDPDAAVRERRLTLLAKIVASVAAIADFAEIVAAG